MRPMRPSLAVFASLARMPKGKQEARRETHRHPKPLRTINKLLNRRNAESHPARSRSTPVAPPKHSRDIPKMSQDAPETTMPNSQKRPESPENPQRADGFSPKRPPTAAHARSCRILLASVERTQACRIVFTLLSKAPGKSRIMPTKSRQQNNRKARRAQAQTPRELRPKRPRHPVVCPRHLAICTRHPPAKHLRHLAVRP